MNQSTVISATYDYRLVALSVLIAICASYTALDLAGRVTAARNNARLAWLFGGAISMGTGIWSMHYTGMLAYRLPVPVYYHIPTVALSWFAAVCASFIALFVVSRERATGLHVLIGGVLMAVGIGAMHYTGMAAMRLSAMHHYEPMLVALSVLVAVMICLAALGLVFQFRDDKQGKVLFEDPNYVFREEYQITREISSFFREESPALDRLSRDVARTLVNDILENY